MSDDVVRVHPSTLARQFFEGHRKQFAAAAMETAVGKQGFYVPQRDFDAFLVECGVLDEVPDSFNSNTIGRRGAVMRRNEIRGAMNASALKAEDYPAFSLSAAKPVRTDDGDAAVMLRVKLINHYAMDRPAEMARAVASTARFQARQLRSLNKLTARHPAITAGVRDQVLFAIIFEPFLEMMQKTALRWEKELKRTEIVPR